MIFNVTLVACAGDVVIVPYCFSHLKIPIVYISNVLIVVITHFVLLRDVCSLLSYITLDMDWNEAASMYLKHCSVYVCIHLS